MNKVRIGIILGFCFLLHPLARAQRMLPGGQQMNRDSLFSNLSYAYRQSLTVTDSMLDAASTDHEKFYLNYLLGLRLGFSGDPSGAQKHLFSALGLAPRCSAHPNHYSTLLLLLGLNYREMDQSDTAAFCLVRADMLQLHSNNPAMIITIKHTLADVYREMNKLQLAEQTIREALPYLPGVKPSGRLRIMVFYAGLHNQMGTETKDIRHFTRAGNILDSTLSLYTPADDPVAYALGLSEMGMTASHLYGPERAIGYYLQSKTMSLEIGDTSAALNTSINLVHEWNNLQDYDKVIRESLEIFPQLQAYGLGQREKELYDNLARAYYATGRYKEAYRYQVLRHEEQMRFNKNQYSHEVDELDKKYQTAKKEEQISIITREREQEKQEKDRKSRQLNLLLAIITVVVILLIVVGVLAYQFRLARNRILEQRALLEKNNELLQATITQKEFLFRELHHRVKNNLQLIMSFMKLQQRHAAQLSIEEFIHQIELKMNAMALVHEKLYQDNVREEIEVKSYLSELCDYILQSIPRPDTDADITLSGEEVRMPIAKAIPVGLIVSEIITNSIKYATRPDQPLLLSVHIGIEKNELTLCICDNGPGFPPGFELLQTNSLGTRVILLLTQQFKGSVNWKNQDGACWTIFIPLSENPSNK